MDWAAKTQNIVMVKIFNILKRTSGVALTGLNQLRAFFENLTPTSLRILNQSKPYCQRVSEVITYWFKLVYLNWFNGLTAYIYNRRY